MSVRIETLAEPLPGYRLIERLGGGGFGEVWKAEAPGGMFKAIKFVYGDLEGADDEGARAGQEFKALKRIITIRHPFILSLERFDIIDGKLLIVTELADRTLWDRFRECRAEGLQGIPREELLRYMADTAEALDLMNSQYQLQHLDIKPQNLFLVGNHVKVADFGLVKDLEGMLASVTGGVTPVYAAPETFEGKVSRFSDQYSLAIVYQELLTGQRPYPGTTLRQLVMQHCQGTPDLKSLPESDRPIVLRALAKRHDDRFASCEDFIQSLRRAGHPTPLDQPVPPAVPASDENNAHGSSDGAEADKAGEPNTWHPGPMPSPMPTFPPAVALAAEPAPVRVRHAETPKSGLHGISTPTPSPTPSSSPAPKPPFEIKPDGVLVPAVAIGLGQFGLGTLRQLRREIIEYFGSPGALPSLRMVFLDTDPETVQLASRATAQQALHQHEVLWTRLHRPSHYIKPRDIHTGLETWLHAKMLYRIPRQQTAAGIRALGRLAFIDNYRAIARRVSEELQACCTRDVLEKAVRETGLNMATPIPRVYIVTSLAGGTGSGMFIDLAYLVRRELRQLGHETAEVVGVCYLPATDRDPRRVPQLANTFAALTELNHFSSPHVDFSAWYEMGEIKTRDKFFQWKGPPFDRCQFYALPETGTATGHEDNGDSTFTANVARTLSTAAHLVFTELATPLGRTADEMRQSGGPTTDHGPRTPGQREANFAAALFQVPGMYRMVWPRRLLLFRASATICQRLVQRWMSKDARSLTEAVKQWVEEKWQEHGLTADQLIGQYQQGCVKSLKEPPESHFQAILNNVTTALTSLTCKPPANGEPALNVACVVQAMAELEQLVGIPEECRPTPRAGEPSSYQPGTLETSLKEMAIQVVDGYEQKMAELVVWLIEQPSYRLAGAEEALRQLRGMVEQALQAHEPIAQELQQRAAKVYQRIMKLLDNSSGNTPTASLWRQTFSRRNANGPPPVIVELLELLRAFPKYRYQSIIMQHVTGLYLSLRGLLSDQLREIDYCRARLGELVAIFADSTKGQSAGETGPPAGCYLFAEGCKSLDEAVRKLECSVTPTEMLELDGRVQAIIRKQFRALVHVCMTSANLLKVLAPAIQKEVRSFLRSRLSENDVADIYLAQFGDGGEQQAEDNLAEAFELAAPEIIASAPARELDLLALPEGAAEQRLRDLARNATPGKMLVAVRSSEEIVLYREQTIACLADLKQLGPLGHEAYQKLISQEHFTPHSRNDIVEWGTR
jgi:serine/threonine protein kinase